MSGIRRSFVVFLLGALSAPALAVGAEDPGVQPNHVVFAGLGLRGDAVREDLVVPLTFSGPGGRLMLGYRGAVGPGMLAVRADMGLAFLFNRYGHSAATLDYGVEASWSARVLRGHAWHVSIGPVVAVDNRVSYEYSWDDAHGYWLGTQWLGPAARFASRLSDAWRIESAASFAVLGFESRPPSYRYNKQDGMNHLGYYFDRPTSNESFVSLADLQILRIDAAVRHAAFVESPAASEIGRGWSFGVDVRFARTTVVATNINLSVCLYAARSWGLWP